MRRSNQFLPSASLASIAIALACQSTPALADAFQGAPTPALGSVTFDRTPSTGETITVNSPQATINWAPYDTTGTGDINFLPQGYVASYVAGSGAPGGQYTVLNRIIPLDPTRRIVFNGTVNSGPGGNIWFYAPGGILVGGTAQFNVGGLLLTANDPVTDASGNFLAGNSFSLAAPAGSTGQVSIASGAVISAPNPGSYVIAVAPRIDQSGSITVNGSAALVAAEAVDFTYNAGLFDITVTQGTEQTDAFTHNGSTQGPAATTAGDYHRIYLVAVPKNNAITMFIQGGGHLGFDIAGAADVDGNTVVLSAGHNIVGTAGANPFAEAPVNTTSASISVSGGSYSSRLLARAATNAFFTAGNVTPLAFASDAIISAAGTAQIGASTGATVAVAGNLVVSAVAASSQANGQSRTGGSANVFVSRGGLLNVTGDVTVDASGYGDLFSPGSALVGNGGAGTGGNASLNTSGGTIIVGGAVSVLASGYGGGNLGDPGGSTGNAFSGSALIFAHDDTTGTPSNGQISIAGDVLVSSNAIVSTNQLSGIDGGNATVANNAVIIANFGGSIDIAGNATVTSVAQAGTNSGGGDSVAGNARVTALAQINAQTAGATVTVGGNALVDASATGGNYTGFTGGAAGNGNAGRVEVAGTSGGTVTYNGAVSALAVGSGGSDSDGGGTGGNGFGGSVDANALSGTTNFTNTGATILLRADGVGGAGQSGGTGTGGSVVYEASTAGTLHAFSAQSSLSATGTGGLGVLNAGGAGTGGTIYLVTSDGASTQLDQSVLLNAGGFGGAGFFGGNGIGGQIFVSGNGATATFGGDFEAYAHGSGGTGRSNGTGGTATGGALQITTSQVGGVRGQINFGGPLTLESSAFGGNADAILGLGGAATGGSVIINASDGTIRTTGSSGTVALAAEGTGGAGAAGGNATGGIARINHGANGIFTTGLATSLSTDAFGGTGAVVFGGNATGGTSRIQLFSGTSPTASFGASVIVSASATGGQSNAIVVNTGGAATGGTATVDAASGALVITGNLTVQTLATGGNGPSGGAAIGGTSTSFARTGTLTVGGTASYLARAAGGVAFAASGFGGGGSIDGGTGGAATGGNAGVEADSNVAGSSTVALQALVLDSRAIGGAGGAGFSGGATGGIGGAGGNAVGGGTFGFSQAQNGQFTATTVSMDTSAVGGAGGVGGNGSTGGAGGRGGDATGGGAINFGTVSGPVSGPIAGYTRVGSVVSSASAFGGNGGAGGNGTSGGIGGSGGNAIAGQAGLLVRGSEFVAGAAVLAADAVGGAAGSGTSGALDGNGGNATGGGSGVTATPNFVNANPANATIASLTATSTAVGGASGTGNGGAATGGDASVQLMQQGAPAPQAANTGSLAITGGLTLNSSAVGGLSSAGNGGAATGGTVNLTEVMGTLTVSGTTSATLRGTGGNSATGAAGSATGGTANFTANGGTTTLTGAVSANAQATAGVGALSGANATGGSITLSSQNGATFGIASTLTLNAQANGGASSGGTSGAVSGGTINIFSTGALTIAGTAALNANALAQSGATGGGQARAGNIFVGTPTNTAIGALQFGSLLSATATSIGGNASAGNGGAAFGGTVTLYSNNVGGTVSLTGPAQLSGNATGGSGGGAGATGGAATGGTVRINAATGGTMTLSSNATLSASGTGGAGPNGGAGTGGIASVTSTGGTTGIAGTSTLTAQGTGGAGLAGFGGAGGIGRGGQSDFSVSNATVNSVLTGGAVSQNAFGTGGAGGSGGAGQAGGRGGDGFGGNVYSGSANSAGLITVGALTQNATGFGGIGGAGGTNGAGGAGGNGLGGSVGSGNNAAGTSTLTGAYQWTSITGVSNGIGGNGGTGGTGAGGGAGGNGTGNSGLYGINGGTFTVPGTVQINVSGFGGTGGAGAGAGSNGIGTGGGAGAGVGAHFVAGGTSNQTIGNLIISANGNGPSPAQNVAGQVLVVAFSGNVSIGTLSMSATGANVPTYVSPFGFVASGLGGSSGSITITGDATINTGGDLTLGMSSGTISVGGALFASTQRNVVQNLFNTTLTTPGTVTTGGLATLIGLNGSIDNPIALQSGSDLYVEAGTTLTLGTVRSERDVDLNSNGNALIGAISAGDSVAIDTASNSVFNSPPNGASVTTGAIDAGIVRPSTDPQAGYQIGINASGGITTGAIASQGNIGFAAVAGGLSTGSISTVRSVLAVVQNSVATGSITTGTAANDFVYISNPSIITSDPNLDALGPPSGFDFSPIFGLTPAPIAGGISIAGPLSTGNFYAATAGALSVSGNISATSAVKLNAGSMVLANVTGGQILSLIAAGGLTAGAIRSEGDIELGAGTLARVGTISAGDSVGIFDTSATGTLAVSTDAIDAGIVRPSTDPQAGYQVGIRAGGDVTTGAINAAGNVGLLTSGGTLLTGAVTTARSLLLLAQGGVSTGSIATGTTGGSGMLIGNPSVLASPGGLDPLGPPAGFDFAPILAQPAPPVAGAITISGPVSTGSFAAAAASTLSISGNLAATGAAVADANRLQLAGVSAGSVLRLTSATTLTAGNLRGEGDVDLTANGNVVVGNISAGDSIGIDPESGAAFGSPSNGYTVVTGNLDAGLLRPSTDPQAGYQIGINADGGVTTGILSALGNIGLSSAAGSISTGAISTNRSFAALVQGSLTTGAISTGTAAGDVVIISNPSLLTADPNLDPLGPPSGFNFVPFAGLAPIPTNGPISIGGAVTTGSFRAATATTLTVSGALSATQVISASADRLSLGALTSGTALVLSAPTITTGAIRSEDDVTITSSGPITLGAVSAGDSIFITSAGGVSTGTLDAGILRPSTNQSAAYGIFIDASGPVQLGALNARGLVGVTARGGALTSGNIDASSIALLAGGAVTTGTVRSAVTGTILVGSDSMASLITSGANAPGYAAVFAATPTRLSGTITLGGATGGVIKAASSGNFTSQAGLAAAASLSVNSGGLASFGGLADAPQIDIRSADIAIGSNGGIGSASTTGLTLTIDPSASAISIGGGTTSGGWSLDGTEASRLRAQLIRIVTQSTQPPVIQLGSLTLTGSSGANANLIGSSARLSIETPGAIRVTAAVTIASAASSDVLQLNAAQRIDVVTDSGGRVIVAGANDAVSGNLFITTPNLLVADATLVGQLTSDSAFAGRNAALAQTPATPDLAGAIGAGTIRVTSSGSVLIQNSGNLFQRAGFTAGSGGFTVIGPTNQPTGPAPALVDVVINGRTTADDGSFLINDMTIDRVSLSPAASAFTPTSSVNGCIVGSICLSADNPVTQAVTDVPTDVQAIDEIAEEEKRKVEAAEQTATEATPQVRIERLLSTRGMITEAPIEEPVTSGGNSSDWLQSTPPPPAGAAGGTP